MNNLYKQKYLKYKQKYTELKKLQHYGGEHTERIITLNKVEFDIDIIKPELICNIDDYYFKFICFFLEPQSHGLRYGIFMISSLSSNFQEYEIFLCYTSQSELDFNRLLYREFDSNGSYGPYYKGYYDYVQQTLIDLRLQKFIFESIEYNGQLYMKDIKMKDIFNKDYVKKEIKKFIDDKTRILNINPFLLNKHICGKIEASTNTLSNEDIYCKIINNLQEYSDKLEEYFEIDEPKFLYNYKKDIMSRNGIGSKSEIIVYFNIDVFYIDLIDKNNKENKYILYFMIYDLCAFNSITFYIDAPTNLNPDLNLNLNLNPDIDPNSNSNLNPDLNQDIDPNSNPEIKYKYDNKQSNSYIENKICKYRNYFAPISIVPSNTKITKFGLPNYVVCTGNYTCKVLEYNEQCTKYENENFGITTTNYSFIGNRYNNLFPFNIIKKNFQNILHKHMPPDITREQIEEYEDIPVLTRGY